MLPHNQKDLSRIYAQRSQANLDYRCLLLGNTGLSPLPDPFHVLSH